MNLETVFDFIKERRGYKMPLRFKLFNRIPLSEDELKIKGDLDLYGENISLLPDNFTVLGFLDIRATQVKWLPDNLTVLGFLDIRATQVKWLPDNLTVGRSLFASFLNIDSIPDNLRVGKDLYLIGTPITEKYSKAEIRKMIEDKGGYVNGIIIA